jgi:hypothetical protein
MDGVALTVSGPLTIIPSEVRLQWSGVTMIASSHVPAGSNLPLTRSSLVGRARELEDVRDLLLREDVPLVTLTGPGGIGKIRRALQLANEVDTRINSQNCGGCGVVCGAGEVCRAGSCPCEGPGCPQVCQDRNCPQGQLCYNSNNQYCTDGGDCQCGCGGFNYCVQPQGYRACQSNPC